jgi:hypothetical protein
VYREGKPLGKIKYNQWLNSIEYYLYKKKGLSMNQITVVAEIHGNVDLKVYKFSKEVVI